MHGFLAGLMGFFMGIASFFHGGHGMPAHNNQPNGVQQSSYSRTASGSGRMRRRFGRGMMKLPAGEKRFLGTVTNVNGSTLTVTSSMMMWHGRNPSETPAVSTTPTPQTLTITLTSSTTYTGGTQQTIATNTIIAGVGTTNSDGSLTALKVFINPMMMRRGGGGNNRYPQRTPSNQ